MEEVSEGLRVVKPSRGRAGRQWADQLLGVARALRGAARASRLRGLVLIGAARR